MLTLEKDPEIESGDCRFRLQFCRLAIVGEGAFSIILRCQSLGQIVVCLGGVDVEF